MKKLLIFVLVIASLGLTAYGAYRFYLPSMIAEALTSNEPSSMVPAEMQEKLATLKVKVDREIKKLPVFLKDKNIAYEDLQIMIDRANPEQFRDAYDEIKSTRINSINQVFDIGLKHVKIEAYDLEIFRSTFVQYVTVNDIQKAITKIENNELLTSMSAPVIKETAKKILQNHESEIKETMSLIE
jgi:hypothetical protein